MTTLRRLSNDNVKTIFDCVYNNKKPDDEKLMFQIIVVGSNGMKLSPPSYEFEDGLYILLKPLKKTKNEKCLYTESPQDDPRIPSQLKSMVFLDKPRLVCPWSLSGPQFPVPTSIQQRYCYPKGDKEYSSKKGGALWTTYDESGKEDLDYRLLHVYYSAKRAGNTGRVSSSSLATTSRKKVKESKEKVDVLALSSSPLHMASLASASFDSPLSFLEVPTSPVDPSMFTSMFVKSFSIDSADSADNESIITPDHSIFDMRSSSHNRHYKDPRLPAPPATKNHQRLYSGGAPTPSAHGRRRRGANVSNSSSSSTSVSFPGSQPPLYHYPHSYPYWMPPQSNPPPCHSCSMDSQDRCNMHWGSPPTSMVTHNSKKQHSYPVQESRKQSASTKTPPSNYEMDEFIRYLNFMYDNVREKIRTSNPNDREQFMHVASNWAKTIIQDPFLHGKKYKSSNRKSAVLKQDIVAGMSAGADSTKDGSSSGNGMSSSRRSLYDDNDTMKKEAV